MVIWTLETHFTKYLTKCAKYTKPTFSNIVVYTLNFSHTHVGPCSHICACATWSIINESSRYFRQNWPLFPSHKSLLCVYVCVNTPFWEKRPQREKIKMPLFTKFAWQPTAWYQGSRKTLSAVLSVPISPAMGNVSVYISRCRTNKSICCSAARLNTSSES